MNAVNLDPIQLDRAAGVLVGGAAGDALGAGYEFRPPVPREAVRMLPGALTGRPAGSWTDDTDMAVAIAQVAATGNGLDLSIEGLGAISARFVDWFSSKPPDIGNQTRSVLSSYVNELRNSNPFPDGMLSTANAYQKSHPDAAGNGSLMRTGPVAIAALGDDAQLMRTASAVSALTHPHHLAVEACTIWCIAIDRAVREGRLDGIHDGVQLLPVDRRNYWTQVLNQAESAPIQHFANNGFVVTALQAAWRSIVSTSDETGPAHLDAALRTAVAMGGDTDTVAAIAGALLGARYGATAVPFAWRRNLSGWPLGLGHRDLVAMAVLATRGGKQDNIGWPGTDDLLPYYEKNWNPSGHVGELAGRSGVLWGDIAGLSEVDADAFISLCRIGKGQRRGAQHHEVWLMDDENNANHAFLLADTADAVETLRQEGKSVFVHCVRAESRTPSVAAAWLIRHHGHSLDDAMSIVREALPGANPNSSMMDALRTLEPAESGSETRRITWYSPGDDGAVVDRGSNIRSDVPQHGGDAVPNDPPASFSPTYQPTDVDRAAAFGGPLAGVTGRLEKLRGHLNYLGFETPGVEAKINGLMFATGMLVDLVDELAKEVAKSMPEDDESADGAADRTAHANADGQFWSVTGPGNWAATGPNDGVVRVKATKVDDGSVKGHEWTVMDSDGSKVASGSSDSDKPDAAKKAGWDAAQMRATADWNIPSVVVADDIRSALELSHPGMAQVLSKSIISIGVPAAVYASESLEVGLLMSTRDAIYTAIEHLSGVDVQELPKAVQMAVTSIQAAGMAIEASFEVMGIEDQDDDPDLG